MNSLWNVSRKNSVITGYIEKHLTYLHNIYKFLIFNQNVFKNFRSNKISFIGFAHHFTNIVFNLLTNDKNQFITILAYVPNEI